MVAEWLRSNAAVYVGNASTKRDFRAQLRGNRAVALWSVYLILLIGYSAVMYTQVSGRYGSWQESVSVSQIQSQLRAFYSQILYFLAAAIAVVAPALTATTIAVERQRRSLDLVFSAPVSTKYYLVGKLMSSYRYTWMLLILSLPVTSVCVVMGGASYVDVLVTYGLLSLHGLALTAIALLVSTGVGKPAGGVVLSYVLTVGYLILGTSAAASSVFFGGMMRQSGEMPFMGQLSMFMLDFSAGSFTRIGIVEVPNWIFTAAVLLLLIKICLLAAGSLLQPAGSKEIAGLRIHALVYLFALAYGLGHLFDATWLKPEGYARAVGWGLMPLLLVVPFITCYGRDRERLFRDDGFFSFRKFLTGARSSALPFLLALTLCGAIGFLLGADSAKLPVDQIAPYLVWLVAFWVLMWAFARWCSAMAARVITARVMFFAMVIAAFAIPPTLIASFVDYRDEYAGGLDPIWSAYPLTPIIGVTDLRKTALVWAALMVLMAVGFLLMERRRAVRHVTPPPVVGVG